MILRQWQLKDLPLENAKLSQTSVVCFRETAIWNPLPQKKGCDWHWSLLGCTLELSPFFPFYYPLAPRTSQPLPHHAAGPTPLPQYSRDYWQPTKLDWKRGEQVQTRW